MKRNRFTKLQGQYLAFIRSYERMHGAPPAEADLQRFFGVTAPAVHDMVVRLHQTGLVSRDPGQARSVRVRIPDDDIPALEDRQPSPSPAGRLRARRLSMAPTVFTSDSHVENDKFPGESFVDCCGRRREFTFELLENDSGYFLRATERAEGEDGYAFAAYAESDPYVALGRLRQRIREGLATRYLAPGSERLLTHGAASGHIASDGVVVDGQHLDYGELAQLLGAYEGWRFTLKVFDPYDAF